MRRRVVTLRFVGAVATLCGVASCRQVLGLDYPADAQAVPAEAGPGLADAGPDAGTNACGLPYGTPACAACASTNCCAPSSACAADAVCDAYESCLGGCTGDPKCRMQCIIDHPPGTTNDVSALSACLASHCETACGLACGALAGYPVEPDVAAACQSCIVSNACDPTRACAASSDCDAINRCLLSCPTPDCFSACVISHGMDPTWNFLGANDDGGIFESFAQAQRACAAPCGLGSYWECVGHVSWPAPKSATTTYDFRVTDYSTGMGVPGVDLSVCSFTDPDCTQPLQVGTTDATGLASMPFQNTRNLPGGGGGLGLNGYLKGTSPSTHAVLSTIGGSRFRNRRSWDTRKYPPRPSFSSWRCP